MELTIWLQLVMYSTQKLNFYRTFQLRLDFTTSTIRTIETEPLIKAVPELFISGYVVEKL